MAHLQYLPGDPRLVDQLVYELKSKGIFDQFRKDCIADVDTRPAYQNLRQRVENSVSAFLARQCWQPDLNKNQLREKLRKHILDGNYLEQGVERIVDQVVNPKVASVFIPQVEDLVYNYLGVTRKKAVNNTDTSNGKAEDLLPTDLEAVSPGSVKSNEDKNEQMDVDIDVVDTKLSSENTGVEEERPKSPEKDETISTSETNQDNTEKFEAQENVSITSELEFHDSNSIDKISIPLPSEEIKLENIPPPESSPPIVVELEKIELPKEMDCSVDIPLPGENFKEDKESYFKPINSDDDSSSDSSLRRNVSPITPIRNYNNENSCDAQQGFDNDSSDSKHDDKKETNQTSSFRFAIESKSTDNDSDASKAGKKPNNQLNLEYQFNNQLSIKTFNTPMYEDSSNSNHLQIDYESDANSKANLEQKIMDADNSEDSKKERKSVEKKSSHRSSHHSRDSYKLSSSKDRRSESKHSTSRDSSRHDKKPKEDTRSSKSSQKEGSKDRSDKKCSKESSRHSSHKSSSHKDSKSHKISSSSQRHSSKSSDDKKSSSHRDKSERSTDKSSRDKVKDSKSNSRSDKDKKSSNKSKHEDKDKEKKEKKESDDHYSLSGRGHPNRRSTDRDSNDGSSSSKGSHNPSNSKSVESKKESKNGSSKSDNLSTSSESTSPCERELTLQEKEKQVIDMLQPKPVVRIDTHLEIPIVSPPHLNFVPGVKLKKPKIAANLEEAKKFIKMRKFLDEEQKRMNQEAALLLEFQANVRPSLSQVYSSIPGPELEFACVKHNVQQTSQIMVQNNVSAHEDITYASEHNNYAKNEDFPDHVQDDIPSTLTVREVEESIENINEELNNKAKAHTYEEILSKETYQPTQAKDNIINPEQSTSSELHCEEGFKGFDQEDSVVNQNSITDEDYNESTDFEVTVIKQEMIEQDESLPTMNEIEAEEINQCQKVFQTECVHPEESDFHYFDEYEKYEAELERDKFSQFMKIFSKKMAKKVYLINCDPYKEKLVKEVYESFGKFEIVNYRRNGHLKLTKRSKNVIKDINLSSEVVLPVAKETASDLESRIPSTKSVFSQFNTDCSFELTSDYYAKLDEMVNNTSRQQIMKIILGDISDSPTMPQIDYLTDSNIDSEVDNNLKRKHEEMETVNNNQHILTPNKMRKLTTPDLISSTTEDLDKRSNKDIVSNQTRSKYLGRARRVGLSRPKKNDLPNSPLSDKSVENYEQNTLMTQHLPNGKIKTTPRNKVQRYDPSDLYKPKLHYLSRRNNNS